MSSEVWVRKSDFRKAIDSHVGFDVLENSLGGKDQADGQADQEYRLRTPPWSNHPGPQRSIGFMFHACRAQQQHYNRHSITALARKQAMSSADQGLYSKLIRLHILHHMPRADFRRGNDRGAGDKGPDYALRSPTEQ